MAGVALLSKYMIGFWLVALAVGLVATQPARVLARPGAYVAAAIAALIVLPNVLWQAAHDWPFLEIGRVGATDKNIALSPVEFLRAETREVNGATAPLWLAGFVAFAAWRRFAALRGFAVAFVVPRPDGRCGSAVGGRSNSTWRGRSFADTGSATVLRTSPAASDQADHTVAAGRTRP